MIRDSYIRGVHEALEKLAEKSSDKDISVDNVLAVPAGALAYKHTGNIGAKLGIKPYLKYDAAKVNSKSLFRNPFTRKAFLWGEARSVHKKFLKKHPELKKIPVHKYRGSLGPGAFVPDIKLKSVQDAYRAMGVKPGVNISTRDAGILAHELGHAVDLRRPWLTKAMAGARLATPVAAVGALTSEKTREHAPLIAGAGYGASTLLPELVASGRGLKALHDVGGWKSVRKHAPKMGRMFLSYAGKGAGLVGGTWLTAKALNKIRESQRKK